MAQIVALLFRIVREVLYVKVAFEQRRERSEDISHTHIWRRSHAEIDLP